MITNHGHLNASVFFHNMVMWIVNIAYMFLHACMVTVNGETLHCIRFLLISDNKILAEVVLAHSKHSWLEGCWP